MTQPLDVDTVTELAPAATLLQEKMALGRIPLIIIGSGVSAGVYAPTMVEIHNYLAEEFARKLTEIGEDERAIVMTILALLKELTAPKPSIGWTGKGSPASPRSVQVRLYNLLQTSAAPTVQKVWQQFGNALLLREVVKRDQPPGQKERTITELDPAGGHIWAAALVLSGRAIVASLNYDGLTKKAVEQLAGRFMSPPPDRRRSCRILSSAGEIERFFSGREIGWTVPSESYPSQGTLPWQPVPLIKFRGDVFHAVCHNERCPEAETATPLYFVLGNEHDSGRIDVPAQVLDAALRCKCCQYQRRLEITFPGVFGKELEIDSALAAFHRFFGGRLAGIIYLGFSGSWDEPLVNYLASRAGTLDIPVISLSRSETLALRDAAKKFGAPYFYLPYEAKRGLAENDFMDLTLQNLIPIEIPKTPGSAPTGDIIPTKRGTLPQLIISYPDSIGSVFGGASINILQTSEGNSASQTIHVLNEKPAVDGSLYSAAMATPEILRLQSCSQLGIKGLLLREKEPRKHTRFHHSQAAMVIARCWYEALKNHAPKSWAVSDEGRIAIELAVLFHDSGHLPFSHMMEEIFRELNWGHRPSAAAPAIPRYRVEEGPELSSLEPYLTDELNHAGVLNLVTSDWWCKVSATQSGRTGIAWIEAMIDSALDADKIEYIFNDTALTGQNVRLAKMPHWFSAFLSGQSITPEGLIRLEGESCLAALDLLQERAHLYRHLYLAPELRGLECLARYIVLTWLEWKVPGELDFVSLKQQKFAVGDDLRSHKAEAAGRLLWRFFGQHRLTGKNNVGPKNELAGLREMVKDLTSGDLAAGLDQSAVEWIQQLWAHLAVFVDDNEGPTIRDAQRAFEGLSPRGPLYVAKNHEGKLRDIARRWRVHYPLLGLIDIASFPTFLATPGDRWSVIGGHRIAAEHFLVPGRHPSQWKKRSHARTPLHECDFSPWEYPVVQVLILDPSGETSGGGAFLDEMLRRELQAQGIRHEETPEAVFRIEDKG